MGLEGGHPRRKRRQRDSQRQKLLQRLHSFRKVAVNQKIRFSLLCERRIFFEKRIVMVFL